jgi:hypothetical protein
VPPWTIADTTMPADAIRRTAYALTACATGREKADDKRLYRDRHRQKGSTVAAPCARRATDHPKGLRAACRRATVSLRGAETGADFCAQEAATVSSRSRDFASGDRRIDPTY